MLQETEPLVPPLIERHHKPDEPFPPTLLADPRPEEPIKAPAQGGEQTDLAAFLQPFLRFQACVAIELLEALLEISISEMEKIAGQTPFGPRHEGPGMDQRFFIAKAVSTKQAEFLRRIPPTASKPVGPQVVANRDDGPVPWRFRGQAALNLLRQLRTHALVRIEAEDPQMRGLRIRPVAMSPLVVHATPDDPRPKRRGDRRGVVG